MTKQKTDIVANNEKVTATRVAKDFASETNIKKGIAVASYPKGWDKMPAKVKSKVSRDIADLLNSSLPVSASHHAQI